MIIFKQWRLWVSLLLLIGSYIFIKPNFESQTSDSKINFGLDIQGGFSYLLELNEEEYLNNLLVKTSQYIENTYSISSDIDNGEIIISKNQNLDALTNIVIQNLGLEINEKSDKENSYIFSKQSFNIPGDLDNNVKEVISKTAKLTLHLEKNNMVGSKTFINEETGEQVRVQEIPNITGDFIQDASLQYNQNEPVVAFSFNKEGSDLFAKMTSENVGSRFAIVLDGSLITAPVIRESITGGSGQISGGFTNETANNLAIILKSGSLPTQIKIIQEKQIGPTLGQEGVEKGVIASIIALIAITLFMIIYYKISGFFTVITIISCLSLLFAMMSLLNTTLTLPGVIGIVLTIGMCVDANVLIFERIRENFKHNIEDPKNHGFNSAYVTILDSNLTTLFAAIFLFAFGFGPIRGFSISLIIGIISSLIVTYIILKLFINITSIKYLGLQR